MHHERRPVRELQPISILVMDICSMTEPTASGAAMFLCVLDKATRFMWVFLLGKKSEATAFIIKFLNELQLSLNTTMCSDCILIKVANLQVMNCKISVSNVDSFSCSRMHTRPKQTALLIVQTEWCFCASEQC